MFNILFLARVGISVSLFRSFFQNWSYYWAICSRSSLKKSDLKQIALITLDKRGTMSKSLQLLFTKKATVSAFEHDKRATGAIHSFLWTNLSFAHKKPTIRSKNWWANAQPGFWPPKRAKWFLTYKGTIRKTLITLRFRLQKGLWTFLLLPLLR